LGNIELVPTSNTLQPQAQAWTMHGEKTPANKLPIFTAELNLIFILNPKGGWNAQGRSG
jgi:hypothetical protein